MKTELRNLSILNGHFDDYMKDNDFDSALDMALAIDRDLERLVSSSRRRIERVSKKLDENEAE